MPTAVPVEPIGATAVLLLVQEPPGIASLSGVVPGSQIASVPVIFGGTGFTVTIFVAAALPQLFVMV